MKIKRQKRVWVAWETHRRSIELAKSFNCDLKIIDLKGFFRYPLSLFQTIIFYFKEKPDVIFVQNPSMVLAFVSCVYSKIFNIRIIVDRHSNFLLSSKKRTKIYVYVFNFLSTLTIKLADLTIVTNKYIGAIVKNNGGRFMILPDKIPLLNQINKINFKHKINLLMVASYAADEPIHDVFSAMNQINENSIALHITGNFKKLDPKIQKVKPDNVYFTGFLDNQTYIDMLYSVDAVLVLTTNDFCMLCGCYEVIAAKNALITSKKNVLIDYFTGSMFVNNSPTAIKEGILEVITHLFEYKKKSATLNIKLKREWDYYFYPIEYFISRYLN